MSTSIASAWKRTHDGHAPPSDAVVHAMYRAAGLPAPGRILWFRSPASGCLAARCLAPSRPPITRELWRRLVSKARGSAGMGEKAPFKPVSLPDLGAWRAVLEDALFDVEPTPSHDLRQELAAAGVAIDHAAVGALPLPACRFGTFDSDIVVSADNTRVLAGAVEHLGVWWAFHDVFVASLRPRVVRPAGADERPHHATLPVLEYADLWCVYAWDSVHVRASFIEAPRSLTPEAIARIWPKLPTSGRAYLLERAGIFRLIEAGCARVVEVQRDRRLLDVHMGTYPSHRYVEVRCPSTGEVHHLRVPPGLQTCAEAVAWTFGMGAMTYRPWREA